MTVTAKDVTVEWLGYATARVQVGDGPVVYTDPGRYGVLTGTWATDYGERPHPRGTEQAPGDGDVVVVTHDHHYDSDGIRRVATDDATVIIYDAVDADRIRAGGRDVEDPEALPYDVRLIGTDRTIETHGLTTTAIPAHNLPDGPNVDADGEPIHPEGFGCGFVIEFDGHRLCWPGDSDVLPVHRELDISLFLPSIARNFTMDRHDAARLAETLRPDLVVPIHYNTFDALAADSRAFAADVARAGIPVALDER